MKRSCSQVSHITHGCHGSAMGPVLCLGQSEDGCAWAHLASRVLLLLLQQGKGPALGPQQHQELPRGKE